VGYRVQVESVSVTVSGDTAVCDGMHRLAERVDVLVHEAVLSSAASASLLAWNAGAVSVGQLASAAGVGTLVLTHLLPAPTDAAGNQAYVDEARSGGWTGPLHVAHDLLRLEL
jgi:ribonuclease BN (tRNA processing enzyme)